MKQRVTRLAGWLGAGLFVASAASMDAAPQNIILMIGDGMAGAQIDAYTAYAGQHAAMQEFPVYMHTSTYQHGGSYDSEKFWADLEHGTSSWDRITDSAAAATALATGQKTINGRLGVDPDGKTLTTIAEEAADLGKSTGVVSSVMFSHATPAGFLAHNESRKSYHEIARQMIDSGARVIMGAGHPAYDNDGMPREPEYTFVSEQDYRRVSNGDTPFVYTDETAEFERLASFTGDEVPDRLFGLAPVAETLQANRSQADPSVPGNASGDPYIANVPGLDVMTRAALNVLEDDEDGFFLMVEGGAIDWACHNNDLARTIEEMEDFDRAVQAAVDWREQRGGGIDETLIIVVSDHDTGLPTGIGTGPSESGRTKWTPVISAGPGELPLVEYHTGAHSCRLVPLYASGEGAEAFYDYADETDQRLGAYLDNTEIPAVIRSLWQIEPDEADALTLE